MLKSKKRAGDEIIAKAKEELEGSLNDMVLFMWISRKMEAERWNAAEKIFLLVSTGDSIKRRDFIVQNN